MVQSIGSKKFMTAPPHAGNTDMNGYLFTYEVIEHVWAINEWRGKPFLANKLDVIGSEPIKPHHVCWLNYYGLGYHTNPINDQTIEWIPTYMKAIA